MLIREKTRIYSLEGKRHKNEDVDKPQNNWTEISPDCLSVNAVNNINDLFFSTALRNLFVCFLLIKE